MSDENEKDEGTELTVEVTDLPATDLVSDGHVYKMWIEITFTTTSTDEAKRMGESVAKLVQEQETILTGRCQMMIARIGEDGAKAENDDPMTGTPAAPMDRRYDA